MSILYYIEEEDGQITTTDDYYEWIRRWSQRPHVAWSYLDGGLSVSTMFLGMDRQTEEGGPPLLYETTAIDAEGNVEEGPWLYSTRAEAQAGHAKVVAQLKASDQAAVGETSSDLTGKELVELDEQTEDDDSALETAWESGFRSAWIDIGNYALSKMGYDDPANFIFRLEGELNEIKTILREYWQDHITPNGGGAFPEDLYLPDTLKQFVRESWDNELE